MRIPITVNVSFWLQLVMLVPGVVTFIPNVINENATPGFVVFAGVFTLGILAFWAWVAVRTRQGRRGFRTFLSVIAGLTGVVCVVDLVTNFVGLPAVTWVNFALSVVAVILLWLPASSAYFDEVSELRTGEPRI
jgi:hypothetical protein